MDCEIMRCRSIRWLLCANSHMSRDDALNFIIYDLYVLQNAKILLKGYILRIEQLLFAVIPNMDCVHIIIENANLLSPFYKVFKGTPIISSKNIPRC
jgi:hypothetical protein